MLGSVVDLDVKGYIEAVREIGDPEQDIQLHELLFGVIFSQGIDDFRACARAHSTPTGSRRKNSARYSSQSCASGKRVMIRRSEHIARARDLSPSMTRHRRALGTMLGLSPEFFVLTV